MKPLEGVTVIELSTMITASFAAMMLAEQGARVIKIEPVEMGDPMRYFGDSKGGVSGLFANCNRGKESIRLNLKDEAAQDIVKQLAKKADVLLCNFRPGVMDKLNLGSDVLRVSNSKLIYAAISGFGTVGPLANQPAYDPVVQAHIGVTENQGGDQAEFVRNLMCDKITAYTACQAVTAALFIREKTGEGQHIDISMLDAGLFYMFPDGFMSATLLDDDVIKGIHLRDMYKPVETLDGQITVAAATQKQIFGIVQALGRMDLLTEEGIPKLLTILETEDEFANMTAAFFAALSTEEALSRLQAADVPCASCLGLEAAIAQPQVVANNSIEVVEHETLGQMRAVRSPARFHGEQLSFSSPCPLHGEHTEAILSELGVSAEEITTLRETDAIGA